MNLTLATSGAKKDRQKSNRRRKRRQKDHGGIDLSQTQPPLQSPASTSADSKEEVDIFGMFGMDAQPSFAGDVLSPQVSSPVPVSGGKADAPARAAGGSPADEFLLPGLVDS